MRVAVVIDANIGSTSFATPDLVNTNTVSVMGQKLLKRASRLVEPDNPKRALMLTQTFALDKIRESH